MKKTVFLLVALAVLFSLSACGEKKTEPQYPLFWTWLDLRSDEAFEAACQKMNDVGIDGVMLNASTPDDYRRVIPIAHAHGIQVFAWLWTMNLEHDRAQVPTTVSSMWSCRPPSGRVTASSRTTNIPNGISATTRR